MREPVVKIAQLVKKFEDKTALNGISLEVFPGEMLGLSGPDGAGKTTLMRILCGLLDFQEGEVQVLGKNLKTELEKVRSLVGYMPERFSLYPDLTVKENLRFFGRLFQVPEVERKEREKRLLKFSGLEEFQGRRAGQLSGGMKQKLALACTLIHQPEVLFLDEPTTGVDPVSREEFWQILNELKHQGTTIMISTPYLDEAEVCDRVAFFYQGKILACDSPSKLKALFPGELYELKGEGLFALAQQLSSLGLEGVVEVQLYGDRLHFHLEEGTDSEKVISQALKRFNRPDLTPRRISPGLENVFAWLIRQSEAKANG